MSKITVAYWSGTGNTEAMAEAVGEGIKAAGKECAVVSISDISASDLEGETSFCTRMPGNGSRSIRRRRDGAFRRRSRKNLQKEKNIALFGSYGWGDGEWMREWESRMLDAGANVLNREGLICHETPDDDALEDCRSLGKQLASL